MYPEDEKEIIDAAIEHIEDASVADGLDKDVKAQPTDVEGVSGAVAGSGSEPAAVDAAMEHIEEASIADGLTK